MKEFGFYSKPLIKKVSPLRTKHYDDIIRQIKNGKINKVEDLPSTINSYLRN